MQPMRRYKLLSLTAALVAGCLVIARAAHAAPATDAPALAAGSRIAVLPSDGARGHASATDRARRERAVGAVVSVLRKQGFELLSDESVRATLDARVPDGCRDPVTCDPEAARQALAADATVAIAFWPAATGPAHLLVYVRHKDGYGQAEVTAADSDIDSAAGRALTQALEDCRVRHDVRVRIESDPAGASITIDRALIGSAPVTLALAAGNHLVTVETPGYVGDTHELEVPAQAQDVFVHRVALLHEVPELATGRSWSEAPAADSGNMTRAARPANHTVDYVVAAVLAAVALPLLGNGLYAAARSGDCSGKRDPAGHCAERVTAGAAMWTSLGLGLAASLGAASVLVFQPFTPNATAHATGASLSLLQAF